MEAPTTALFGCRDMTGTLRRVLVRTPQEDVSSWRGCGWRSEPDSVRLRQEHEDFCALLEEAGAEVVLAPPVDGGNLDDVYAFDPALVTEQGVVLLRPGKECRRGEPAALERDLAAAGIPVARRLDAPAEAEGGDLIRLDDETLLAGYTLPHERGRGRGARRRRARGRRLRRPASPRPWRDPPPPLAAQPAGP